MGPSRLPALRIKGRRLLPIVQGGMGVGGRRVSSSAAPSRSRFGAAIRPVRELFAYFLTGKKSEASALV
jgi:lipase chaperone LimK